MTELSSRKRLDIWWRFKGQVLLWQSLWYVVAGSTAVALVGASYVLAGTIGALAVISALPLLTVRAVLLQQHLAERKYRAK